MSSKDLFSFPSMSIKREKLKELGRLIHVKDIVQLIKDLRRARRELKYGNQEKVQVKIDLFRIDLFRKQKANIKQAQTEQAQTEQAQTEQEESEQEGNEETEKLLKNI